MDSKQTLTLEEALKIIAQQQFEIHRKNNEIQNKENEIQNKNNEIQNKNNEIQNKNNEIRILKERLSLQLAWRFAKHSEKYYPEQPSLFDEDEQFFIVPEEDKTKVHDEQIFKTEIVNSYKRNKKGRKPLSDELPRIVEVIDIKEEDKHCACGAELSKIGEDVSEYLVHIPSQIYVKKIIRPIYACRKCEGSGDEEKSTFRQAPAPKRIIEKSISSPSLLASVFTNKFELHLPYYRQEKAYEHRLINISRQDMACWQEKIYSVCRPLEDLIIKHIKSGNTMHMDETTVKVLRYDQIDEDREKSYMWLATGGPAKQKAVIYRYFKSRSAENVKEFINGFSGFLMTDGYKGYMAALTEHEKLYPQEKITHACCLAHSRRKFMDAVKVSKSKSAEVAVKYISDIYKAEKECHNVMKNNEDLPALRKGKVKPIFDSFKIWLKEKSKTVPHSLKFGEAVAYTLEYWDWILNYMECPELTPDNNEAENSIRPFVCGRKNWLFAGSEKGARSSCFIYTLIENAKLYGLNPYDYLRCLFERVPSVKTNDDFAALLPWNIKISPFVENCKWGD
jgi:transposase